MLTLVTGEFKFNDTLNDHKNDAKYVIFSPYRAHTVHFEKFISIDTYNCLGPGNCSMRCVQICLFNYWAV